jgi:DNA polymerase-3 subunit delta
MLIAIYGADTYRSREKLRALTDAFREKHDNERVNLTRLVYGGSRVDELRNAVLSQPFLGAAKRMIVAENFLARKADGEALQEVVRAVPESTVLVFWDEIDEAAAAKIPLFGELKKNKKCTIFVFSPLAGPSLTRFVKDETGRLGKTIANRAVEYLIANVGPDLWRLKNELDKLAAFSSGEEITLQDAELLLAGAVEENVFAILNALADRDSVKASRLAREQMLSGVEATYLLAMLLRQIRIIVQIRSYLSQTPRAGRDEIARVLKLHPFVAQRTVPHAQSFNPAQLLRLMRLVFVLERQIKTGKISAELAVLRVIAETAI